MTTCNITYESPVEGTCCISSTTVTQSIIIRCNGKKKECQLNHDSILLPLRILILYLVKGLLQNFLDIDFIIYHSHIYAERKVEANKLIKVLLKLVHIHSPPLHKSLFDSGKNVLFASHGIID